jgi:hypothetical protein
MEKVSSEKLVNRYLVDLNNEEDALIAARNDMAKLEQSLVEIENERSRLRLQLTPLCESANEFLVDKVRSFHEAIALTD